MSDKEDLTGLPYIENLLKEKACTKQEIYQMMKEVFDEFKEQLRDIAEHLKSTVTKKDHKVEISYKEEGAFEAHLKFSGDVLIFTMHSNIFSFDENHQIHQTKYVEDDPRNGYFGMIQVHNFLADSFKFKRLNDLGYLIGRIFINREKHFFVEGKRQLGFLFTDVEKMILSKEYIKQIIESSIICALDFELLVPPFDAVKMVSVQQKIVQQGNASFKTAKRLGFEFSAANEENV